MTLNKAALLSAARFVCFAAAAAAVSAALAEVNTLGLPDWVAASVALGLTALAKYIEANRRLGA